jgi:hypothetical protein
MEEKEKKKKSISQQVFFIALALSIYNKQSQPHRTFLRLLYL